MDVTNRLCVMSRGMANMLIWQSEVWMRHHRTWGIDCRYTVNKIYENRRFVYHQTDIESERDIYRERKRSTQNQSYRGVPHASDPDHSSFCNISMHQISHCSLCFTSAPLYTHQSDLNRRNRWAFELYFFFSHKRRPEQYFWNRMKSHVNGR